MRRKAPMMRRKAPMRGLPVTGPVTDPLAAGVYRQVPTPKNPLVPQHRFVCAARIRIGEDEHGG